MTYEEAFTRLGLEQPATFADKVMASPWHVELLAGMPEHERHRYVYAQTGRTTARLVWAAWRVGQGRKALVWVLPSHVEMVRRQLATMVQTLGGDARNVRVVSSAPTCSSMAGTENVVLVQDHAVPSAWDRDLVRMAVLKGWEVG